MESQPASRPSPPLGTLAERLEWLFEMVRPTSDEVPADQVGRPYTNREIANKINALALESGTSISAAYIGELRRGAATDPRASHLQALANAFGVNAGFFVDDQAARRVQEQINLLRELRKMDVTQVALRRVLNDSGLSRESVLLVEQMVARLRAVEVRAL